MKTITTGVTKVSPNAGRATELEAKDDNRDGEKNEICDKDVRSVITAEIDRVEQDGANEKLSMATSISDIADNINTKSSSKTSMVTNSSSSTSEVVYKKQFLSFKTPSSRTEMIEKKKVLSKDSTTLTAFLVRTSFYFY